MVSPVSEATDRCTSCGNDLRAKARFCDGCGAAVASRAATGEHKQVTVLFADVVGSMRLASALEAERLQEVMNALFNRASAVVQRYQGTVDKFTGDGLMALFGAPVALEDHALRACISALEIQAVAKNLGADVFSHDGADLQIRIGLNSGNVIVGEIGSGPGRYTAIGHPVGMAQRMEAGAPPGGVLCSLTTARLVDDAARFGAVEEIVIKGSEESVPARELVAVESDRKVVGRNEGLMLGRDDELNWLRDVLDDNRGCLVGVVGAPGVGKSRLISEFASIAVARDNDVVTRPLRGPHHHGRVSGVVAPIARPVQGGGAQRCRGPAAHRRPVRRTPRSGLRRRTNSVRSDGNRRRERPLTAGQRRRPAAQTFGVDETGRPGARQPNVVPSR
jgi:adenylate cyclase